MIKKYYTLLIASESDHINRSIRISRLTMLIFLIFLFSILIFSYFGFINQFNLTDRSKELKYLKNFESNVIELIYNDNLKEFPDSVIIFQLKNIIHNGSIPISMVAPVDGYITQGLDESKNHYGVDIVSKKGDNIKVALDGVVIFSGFLEDLGNTLIISHPYDYFTIYGHCDSLFVKTRDVLKKGDIIGSIGETGKTTAPHLHFEIWNNDIIIDPRNIINKYGDLDVSAE